MTTIACDGFTMAGDTQAAMNGDVLPNQKKVLRVGDCLIGMAGSRGKRALLVEWVENGMAEAEAPDFEESGVGIVLTPQGRVTVVDGVGALFHFKTPMAIGSAAIAARAAMRHGATAREAIRTCIDLDVYTGGRVYALDIRE